MQMNPDQRALFDKAIAAGIAAIQTGIETPQAPLAGPRAAGH